MLSIMIQSILSKLALDFANYGLSITPKIASVPKNFFKTYIRSGEVLK